MAGMRCGRLILLMCLFRTSFAVDYSNSALVNAHVTSESLLDSLVQFLESDDIGEEVDIWSVSRTLSHPVTFTVTRQHLPAVETWLSGHHVDYTVQHDLDDMVEKSKESEHSRTLSRSYTNGQSLDLNVYNDHEQINTYLYDTEADCDICDAIHIGRSYEGRDMVVLRVGQLGRHKPAIWIDAGIHAREWVAPAVALKQIYRLVNGYKTQDPDVVWMLDNFVWYILPSANPDGYMYSRESERFWRKTRRPNRRPGCVGTDPNRNWNFHWAGAGTSADPCSEIFHGPTPFSEIETRNIRNFLYRRRRHFVVYLSYHSYGQYWLYPWGFNSSLPDDWEEIHRVGQRAVDRIFEFSGEEYTLGSSTNVLYAAAGASDDWAKGVAKIKYSYTVELRDQGNYGFLLPSSEIQATADEHWVALQEMSRAVREYVDGVLTESDN